MKIFKGHTIELECKKCKVTFSQFFKIKRRMYCDSCLNKNCIFCGSVFSSTPSQNLKTCSLKCRSQLYSKIKLENYIGKVCIVCNTVFKKMKHKSVKTCSKECRSKYLSKIHTGRVMPPKTLKWRIEMSEKMKGDKAPNWKGGVTPIHKRLRKSIEFKVWRDAVFKRDDWTCQVCKIRGGTLHPDHIKQFALFPELRFEINNGRTLCATCHKQTDTWGKNIPKDVYEKYLTNK